MSQLPKYQEMGFFPLRGSNSKCRVPKEMSGHGKGRVNSIPKPDRGIGKRVSQIVLKMSGHFLNAVISKRFFEMSCFFSSLWFQLQM